MLTVHTLFRLCTAITALLALHHANIVAVYCSDGVKVTGAVIAAFLLFTRLADSPREALQFFANKRTDTGEINGMLSAASRQLLDFFTILFMREGSLPYPYPLYLQHIVFHGRFPTRSVLEVQLSSCFWYPCPCCCFYTPLRYTYSFTLKIFVNGMLHDVLNADVGSSYTSTDCSLSGYCNTRSR